MNNVWKTKPLDLLDNLYSTSNEDSECLKKKLLNHFQSSPESINQLPFLNVTLLEKIPSGHLIRVMGMVQDMFDPEVYVEHFTVIQEDEEVSCKKRLGRYRDTHDLKSNERIDETSVKLSERQAFYLVPIPGLSSWVKEALSSQCQFISPSTCGRKRSFDKLSDANSIECGDDCLMETDDLQDGVINKKFKDDIDSDKENVGQVNNQPPTHLAVKNVNKFPDGYPYLIHIYEKFEDFKLNDLIEIVGVYQEIQASSCQDKSMEGEEFTHPIQSLISTTPQVHALIVNRLPHCNPFLPRNIFDSALVDTQIGTPIGEIRDFLFATLLDGLLGDSLAAEYLLLHLLSSVGNHSLGCKSHFTMNLSRCTQDLNLPTKLFSLLSVLMSSCLLVELSRNALSASKEQLGGREFYPVRDNNTGRLEPGILQVANHTQIVVDETLMSEGQLDSKACLNLQALMAVAADQNLPYDFQFYTKNYDTDVMMLILSETKSIIKGCVEVPWSPCDPLVHSDSSFNSAGCPSSPKLSDVSLENVYCQLMDRLTSSKTLNIRPDVTCPVMKMRQYLSVAQFKKSIYKISDQLQERINEDFVRFRKEDADWMTVDQFKFMLDLLRLETFSYGDNEASVDSWDKILKMEMERKKRLK